jgi:lipopolysaccharide assembly outer membrane protein LptD (OstA)
MYNTINSVSYAFGRVFWAAFYCAVPCLSHAAAWQLEPSIALEGSYQDNARLKVDKADQDKIYSASLSPTLKLARFTDLTTLDGVISLDFIKDWGDIGRLSDKVPRRILSGFSLTRKGELSRLNLRGRYIKDTIFRAANTSEVDDPEQPPTPGSVDEGFGDDVNRQRIDIRPSFTYALTERWQMGLGYQFLRTFFDNPNSLDPRRRLSDFDRHTINGRVSVPITEKNKLVSILSVSRFDSENRFEGDQERTTDNYALQAGLRHDFDETMSFTLTAGGRYTVFDVTGGGGEQNDQMNDTGYVARLNAFKKTGFTTFDANLEHNLSPSGVGDQVVTDELNFKIVRNLTEFISVSLFTRIFQNESIESETSQGNRRSLRMEPSLSWTLAEAWSLVATYRYQRQKDFGEPDPAEGNSAFLTLIYQPPSELGK